MTISDIKTMTKAQLQEELTRLLRVNEEQADRIARLEGQVKSLKADVSSRVIAANEAGSIAQAALTLNGVFESAQQAADQYLASIERMKADQQAECERLLNETRQKCRDMEIGTQRRCDELYRAAQQESSEKWAGLAKQLESTMRDYLAESEKKS